MTNLDQCSAVNVNMTIVGVDVDDVVGDEDAHGPTPGDVHRVYGAVRQIGDARVLDLNDIDTLS